MTVEITVNLENVMNDEVLDDRLKKLGLLLQEQTIRRIREGKDDEITFKPLDFVRPDGSKDRPLFDTGHHLIDSITHGVDDDGAWVGSNFVGAAVHQQGTTGKGGTKKTIKPVRAKALFIPRSREAARSVPETKAGKKVRVVAKKSQGRTIKKTVKRQDFLLVGKVDINARPFLRLSKGNLEEVTRLFETGEL